MQGFLSFNINILNSTESVITHTLMIQSSVVLQCETIPVLQRGLHRPVTHRQLCVAAVICVTATRRATEVICGRSARGSRGSVVVDGKKKKEKKNIQKGQSQALSTSMDRFHRSLKLNRCLIKVDSNHDLVTEVLLDFVLWCFDQPWWSQSCNQDRWRSQRCLHESDSAGEWRKERRRCSD